MCFFLKISIQNIGKIKRAEVQLDGISVIAGKNNTGKSTVARTLFAVANTICESETRVYEERKSAITHILEKYGIFLIVAKKI